MAKHYRQHKWKKRKESLIQHLVALILRFLKEIVKSMQNMGLMKKRVVEKVNVE